MAKSSINLKLAAFIAFMHNVREALVTYTIGEANRNFYDKNGEEAFNYYRKLLSEAVSNYTQRTGQRVQTDKKKFLWEAVVNLNHNHELKDLQNLAKVLEEQYGWQPVQCAVHRDEGHIDKETGEKIYNFHGHIVFFMLSQDGKYAFKKQNFGIKKMQGLQTLVANTLGMERGIPKSISKRIRLEHNQYRQVAQSQEKEKNKFNRLQAMYDRVSQKLTIVSKNKKKTASEVRKSFKKREQHGVLSKLKQFCINTVGVLFHDLSKYPLLHALDLSDDGLIFEWMHAAQEKILSLVAENKVLRDRLISFEESYRSSDNVQHEDEVDLPQPEAVCISSDSFEKLQEEKEYIEMADFYYDDELENHCEFSQECEHEGEEEQYDDEVFSSSDDEELEYESLDLTTEDDYISDSENEIDEKEDGSEDHEVLVSASEFELALYEEARMLNIDIDSDTALESGTDNLNKEVDIKKEKKSVNNKIKFKR